MKELDEVQERREALLAAAASLEGALAAPASDMRWSERLGEVLMDLRATFDEHVTATEGLDGVLAQVRDRAPRLSGQIDRLVDEHVTIGGAVERLVDRIDHVPAERTAQETAAIREDALDILAVIMRHRQLGADLLYEAYNVDVGGLG
jgi:hypothetical protein